MTAIDPHRTLGLAPGASQAEIKRAYRHLAKLYHPDSAGERALPRFLAVQAAYEALVDDPARRRGNGRTGVTGRPGAGPTPPWQADPSRARATREAYRARARPGAGASGATGWGTAGSGRAGGTAAGAPGRGASAGGDDGTPRRGEGRHGGTTRDGRTTAGGTTRDGRTTAGGTARDGRTTSGDGASGGDGGIGSDGGRGTRTAGTRTSEASREGPGSGDRSRSSRARRHRKATIGSTSYDGADQEPFAPPWEGATWYGAGSGTYWTLNPKEYADPRKHGPEYQARSRRPLDDRTATGWSPESTQAGSAGSADGSPRGPDPSGGMGVGTRSEGGRTPAGRATPSAAAGAPGVAGGRGVGVAGGPSPAAATRPTSGRADGGAGVAGVRQVPLVDLRSIGATLPGRLGLAVLGWSPLAVALAALSETVDPLRTGIWIVHLLLLGLLVAVPRLGAVLGLGGAAFLLGGLAATPVLLVLGGAQTAEGTAGALAVVLAVAWLAGVALGLSGRVDLPPWRAPRVR